MAIDMDSRQWWATGLVPLVFALGCSSAQPDELEPPVAAASAELVTPTGTVRCDRLKVVGTASSSTGATWTYASTDDQIQYRLSGVLHAPVGSGPFGAVVVSHGKGGSPTGYSRSVARKMVPWGLVAIGVGYTHGVSDSGLPAGGDGASEANIRRATKALQLLRCLRYVDVARVAAHGHSMGAFLTGALLGTHPVDFRAASHTAGGTSSGPNATPPELAQAISTPYQLHHGDADTVVRLAQDEALAAALSGNDVPHELHVYAGVDHQQITLHTTMLTRVRQWYKSWGVLPP